MNFGCHFTWNIFFGPLLWYMTNIKKCQNQLVEKKKHIMSHSKQLTYLKFMFENLHLSFQIFMSFGLKDVKVNWTLIIIFKDVIESSEEYGEIHLILNGLMCTNGKPCYVGYDYNVERIYFPCNLLGPTCKQSNAKKSIQSSLYHCVLLAHITISCFSKRLFPMPRN
jgi:hypothetical protein